MKREESFCNQTYEGQVNIVEHELSSALGGDNMSLHYSGSHYELSPKSRSEERNKP
jgi:hypothetical protein